MPTPETFVSSPALMASARSPNNFGIKLPVLSDTGSVKVADDPKWVSFDASGPYVNTPESQKKKKTTTRMERTWKIAYDNFLHLGYLITKGFRREEIHHHMITDPKSFLQKASRSHGLDFAMR